MQTIVNNHQFRIDSIELGPMENLIYLITDKASQRCAVVDPAWEPQKLIQMAQNNQATISDILLTHSHHDHINGVDAILDKYDSQLHLLKAEADFWQNKSHQLNLCYGGDEIQLGKTTIQILYTPGHTPGSACYKIADYLITGDTLFVWGCGHCRLGGDPEILYDTLTKLAQLPQQIMTLPGHNYADKTTATMAEQCQGNPFLHFHKKADFVDYRTNIHDEIRQYPYTAELK